MLKWDGMRHVKPVLLLFCLLTSLAAAQGFEWPESTPEQQGIDGEALRVIIPLAEAGEFNNITSLTVLRHGVLVFEHYLGDYTPDELYVQHSITKSVGTTLLGIALYQGLIESLDSRLLDYFPQYSMFSDPLISDPRPAIENINDFKLAITLRNSLQMRSGLEWDEWTLPYLNPANPLYAAIESDDWTKFVLDLPATAAPGTRFDYNTPQSDLVSAVLHNVSALDGERFAATHLFSALDIEHYEWALVGGSAALLPGFQDWPGGFSPLGHGLFLQPRDMAKIGQLWLQRGIWQERRLFDESFVDEAWTAYSNGDTDPEFFSANSGYGLQWWFGNFPYRDSRIPVWYAAGSGHQYILVVRDLDLVVVITAEDFDREPSFIVNLMSNHLLPAVVDDQSFLVDTTINGAWFNAATPGQGVLMEYLPQRQSIFAAWFTWAAASGTGAKLGDPAQRWLTLLGPVDGAFAALDVILTTGGRFDHPQPVEHSEPGAVGTVNLQFTDCNNATMEYQLNESGLSGSMPLVRVAPLSAC